MRRSIGRFLNWVSNITRSWALRCGHPALPLMTPMGLMREGRMGMRLMAEIAMKDSLARRARNGRNQADDNKVVAPMNAAINEAIAQGDFRLAAEIFRENYGHILAYEKASPPCEIHKGAITFDVARAYLQGWDFFAAMHNFELAERETWVTTADNNFNIYNFDLFEKNFWDAVQVNTARIRSPSIMTSGSPLQQAERTRRLLPVVEGLQTGLHHRLGRARSAPEHRRPLRLGRIQCTPAWLLDAGCGPGQAPGG
ncbi:MAG: hypothetical protein R3C17_15810 [Planctomycetaceae bacterium]